MHLNSLSLILLMTRSVIENSSESYEFTKYVQDSLANFVHDLSAEDSCYEHLEYAGCGSIMRVARWPTVEEIFLVRFGSLFAGKSDSQVRTIVYDKHPEIRKLFDVWSNTTISRFNLTTVGVSIAQANCRRKIGQKVAASSPIIVPYVDKGH